MTPSSPARRSSIASRPRPAPPSSTWSHESSASCGASSTSNGSESTLRSSATATPPRRRSPSFREAVGRDRDAKQDAIDAVVAGQEKLDRDVAEARTALEGIVARELGKLRAEFDSERERIDATLSRERAAGEAQMARLETRMAAVEGLSETPAKLAALEERLGEVERVAQRGDELSNALSRYQQPHRGDPETGDDGRVDINSASFEDLRALGLSVTQGARLVALRDARGGFKSEEELAELPGFPPAQLSALLTMVRV